MILYSKYGLLYLTTLVVLKIESRHAEKCECGIANDDLESNRIVGGSNLPPHRYPWLIYISRRGELHCGGALISNRYVLTAGHCVKWTNKSDLDVVLGRHDRFSNQGIVRKISLVKIHPDFTSDKLHDTNDIALVKLRNAVAFSKTVSPVCLPHPLSEYENHTAIVAGWGRMTQLGKSVRYARKANVKIMPDRFCLSSPIGEHYADSMMCAYGTGCDACQGDSGGPLLFERSRSKIEIIGIVSWGIGCAQPNMPGVYTKIVNYLQWIVDNTLDSVYCEKN